MHVHVEHGALVRSFGTGPTVVCVHGFCDNGSMFMPLAATTAASRFTFVVPDMPGFGASPRQDDVELVDAFAEWLNRFVREVEIFGEVGLVAHSAFSLVAMAAVERAPNLYAGLFSIEGNLTEADAYFSGQAADYEGPQTFKAAFLEYVWKAAQQNEMMRRYYGAVTMADSQTMWRFGRDAKALSAGTRSGDAFASLPVPALHYWSQRNTPERTGAFIRSGRVKAKESGQASHWPTIDSPAETGDAIAAFFEAAFAGRDGNAAHPPHGQA